MHCSGATAPDCALPLTRSSLFSAWYVSTLPQAESIAGCLDEIETHLSRSADFLRGGHVRNCVAMLEVLTPHVVGWMIEQGKIEELEEEDRNTIQAFTAILVRRERHAALREADMKQAEVLR